MGLIKECLPSRDTLSQYLDYEPETGVFRWKVTTGRVKPGDIAGTKASQGHLVIRLGGSTFMAHRLAWLFATGSWPHRSVRHRNGNPTDNRFANLVVLDPLRDRDRVTRKPVVYKRNRSTPHGVFSVHFPKQDLVLYQTNATVGGQTVFIGRFETVEEAQAAFTKATGQATVPTYID